MAVSKKNSSTTHGNDKEEISFPVVAIGASAGGLEALEALFDTFALAQGLLERNKRFSPRRTIEPTLLQGMLVCGECGYAFYRTSTQTSKRKLYYYRCLGSDDY
ncbi:MAG: recombinase zinc beta ribbon domain-containing protein, partial [Syntrophobacteraceae bacterium]